MPFKPPQEHSSQLEKDLSISSSDSESELTDLTTCSNAKSISDYEDALLYDGDEDLESDTGSSKAMDAKDFPPMEPVVASTSKSTTFPVPNQQIPVIGIHTC